MLKENIISNIKWSKVDIIYTFWVLWGYSGKQKGASVTLLEGRKNNQSISTIYFLIIFNVFTPNGCPKTT
jgi:hypothetical protein